MGGTTGGGPKPCTFNMSMYKLHALGDYIKLIWQFGMTDNYSTQVVSESLLIVSYCLPNHNLDQGELEHRWVKRFYSWTNKISFTHVIAKHQQCEQCRAGWIAACTTALCLRFDSPTLGPLFPIPRPIALLLHHIALGHVAVHCVTLHHVRSVVLLSSHIASHRIVSHCVTLHQVMSQCIGSVALLSGHITSRHIGLGQVTSHHIRLHRIRSGRIALGQSCYYQPYLV